MSECLSSSKYTNITLNLYYYPEPNEPHTHTPTHPAIHITEALLRWNERKKNEKRRKTWIPFGQLPLEPLGPLGPHLSTWPCSLDSKWNAQVCMEFWFSLPSASPPIYSTTTAETTSSAGRSDSVRHVVRLQINLMSVILLAKWEIFEISSKIRCVPSDRRAPRPDHCPTPTASNICCSRELAALRYYFFFGAGYVSHLSETHLNVNFRRVACPWILSQCRVLATVCVGEGKVEGLEVVRYLPFAVVCARVLCTFSLGFLCGTEKTNIVLKCWKAAKTHNSKILCYHQCEENTSGS